MRAAEESIGPVPQPDTERSEAPGTLPEWRQILQGLPAYTPGKHLTGGAAANFRDHVIRAYRADGTIREICEETGRSYSPVHMILSEAGVLRPPGPGARAKWSKPRGSTAHRRRGEKLPQFVERVIRGRVDDGTYLPGQKIPSGRLLAKELGVSAFTVDRAVRELKKQGVLESTSANALGTFVCPSDPRP